ncbi:MAG: hypothetical protein HYT73_02755 [Candidatus Aenigmarchaeota archaeon]|nr:hypothetical protein [Candidatus Aenigmarchaeota archaeon]
MKKGAGGWFIILSIIGILVGIMMVITAWGGSSMSPMLTLLIGIFVVIKEILDIAHG